MRAVGAQPDLPARVPARRASSLSIFGESDEKFHIRGGNQQLPEAIAALPRRRRRQDGATAGQAQGNRERPIQSHVRAGRRHDRRGRRLRGAGDPVCRAERHRHRPGRASTRSSTRRSPNRAAVTTASCIFSSTRRGWLGAGPWPGVSNGSSYADTGYQAELGSDARTRRQRRASWSSTPGGSTTDAAVTNQAFANAGNARSAQRTRPSRSRRSHRCIPGFRGMARRRSRCRTRARSSRRRTPFYKVGQYTTFGGYEARAAGRRAVLRRAHVDRLPGLHGRRCSRGAARRAAARAVDGSRLTRRRENVSHKLEQSRNRRNHETTKERIILVFVVSCFVVSMCLSNGICEMTSGVRSQAPTGCCARF